MTHDDPTRPDYHSKAFTAMKPDVELCRDVAKGTRHLRDQNTKYLPRHPKENGSDYARRLALAVLFNALDRTVKGLAGMVFRRDPVLGDDVPAQIVSHAENIDNAGTHFDAFTRALFEDGLLAGHMGILVDVPRVGSERRLTDAEERQLGVRPYWVPVRKDAIVNWRTGVVAGRTVLTLLVLHEPTLEPDGEFGEEEHERYRVYRRDLVSGDVTVEVWEIIDDKPTMVEDTAPVTNQSEIPLAIGYSGRTALLESRPPLLDLAHTNVAHYQTLADHRYALHIANVPGLVISGVDTDHDIAWGPNMALKIPDPNGKAMFVEPSGNSFEANHTQLGEFKADMAAMGLAMLQRESRAAETAEAKRLDKSVEESALATAARSLQDCLEQALGFHASFMRLDSGGSVTINRDFEDNRISARDIAEYRSLVMAGQLSLDTLWQVLIEGDALPEDFDPEVERERIESSFDPNVLALPGGQGGEDDDIEEAA